jgi:hypothetical protein
VIGEEIDSVSSMFSKAAAKGEGAFKLGERGQGRVRVRVRVRVLV